MQCVIYDQFNLVTMAMLISGMYIILYGGYYVTNILGFFWLGRELNVVVFRCCSVLFIHYVCLHLESDRPIRTACSVLRAAAGVSADGRLNLNGATVPSATFADKGQTQ